ncbi:MliC family protein [Providencia vermicola]|uniref:MliC family protein n=1 Tax=Providencia vermicola TaxID=333965 RepID=UPI001CEC9523|nr:MliC family protein [Providencia vermicola]
MSKFLPIITLASIFMVQPALAAKTDTYNCEGQKIRVSFPNEQLAVMYYSDELIVLKEAVSASGARYVGENFQLWSQGKNEFNLATISEDDAVNGRATDDKGRTCKLVK